MNSLAICVATMKPNPNVSGSIHREVGDVSSFTTYSTAPWPKVYTQWNTPGNNLGVVGSYHKLYVESTEDLLMFCHDDVVCREEGWNERVAKEFEDPKVGLCGPGGAKWHGTADLYKVPYKLQNLRRGDYLSNVDDSEIHGARFTGSCDVAVLDGFALVVRRTLLDRMGGWSAIADGCNFYCYDYAICAWARRLGYRIRLVGIRCHHRGGVTSVNTGASVREITSPEAYERSHRWYYESFMDVMPARVK